MGLSLELLFTKVVNEEIPVYIEQRVSELESKFEKLSRQVEDLVLSQTSDKPILNFYTYVVPVEWEDFTDTVVGVALNGRDLTYTNQDNFMEYLALDNCGLADWLHSFYHALPHLPVKQGDQLRIGSMIRYLGNLPENESEREHTYKLIKAEIEHIFVLKFDSYLECDYNEFTL